MSGMWKHVRRVLTVLTPTALFVGYMLTHDISLTLAQADKSSAQMLAAIGLNRPPQHLATYVWHHPFLAALVLILLFGIGAAISWGIEAFIGRLHRRPARRPATAATDPVLDEYERLSRLALADARARESGVINRALDAEPPPRPSFEELLKQRERLSEERANAESNLQIVKNAVEQYHHSIAYFSREKVIRPTMRAEDPERTFPLAESAFRSTGLKDGAWNNEFQRPKPVYSEWADPGVANRQRRLQMFDPADNDRYLSKHRQNLVILEEAAEEAERKVALLNDELVRLNCQIQQEANNG